MTIERAIAILDPEYPEDVLAGWNQFRSFEAINEACTVAVAALRAQQNEQDDCPLTKADLREMDGEPVWVVFIPDSDGECLAMWSLISVDSENDEIFLLNSIGGSSAYEEVWADIKAIYRRKPKGDVTSE